MRKSLLISTAALFILGCGKKGDVKEPLGTPEGENKTEEVAAGGNVSVKCEFEGGWAAFLPETLYRQDEFLMQALIGLTEEPSFWGTLGEYKELEPYSAKPCGTEGVTFPAQSGRYILLVGWTGSFDEYGDYKNNGFMQTVEVAGDLSFTITREDLTLTFLCISCPHIYVWTGTDFEHRGEILRDVIGVAAERSERTPIGKVQVIGGEVRLRIAEQEEEVSHINAVLLEIEGRTFAPEQDLLREADAAYQVLHRGESIDLVYRVDLPDGPVEASVVATGYYIPLLPLR